MSQIAEKKFPHAMLLGGLSVNLNHLKMGSEKGDISEDDDNDYMDSQMFGQLILLKLTEECPSRHTFYTQPPEVVDEIPPDIDGFKLYKITANQSNYNQRTADQRWFVM